ncbi:MAG: glycosyltransferase family 2 protein [Candidatus Bathyarchaeia archaeon]
MAEKVTHQSAPLPLVSVVIVTRNRRDDVIECLSSLRKSNYPDYELILVDNDSADDTVDRVSEQFPEVRMATSRFNLGLTGGRNVGQKLSKGRHILFLDSDTTVDKYMIFELVKAMETYPNAAIVAPKIYSYLEPNIVWYAGAKFNLLTSRARNVGAWSLDHGEYDEVTEASHAPTAFLVRKDVADQIGGHDNVFVMTYGDADFALRARRKGYSVLYIPTARMFHKVQLARDMNSLRSLGLNTPLRSYFFAKNKVIFMKRHARPHHFAIFLSMFFPIFTFYYSLKILTYSGGMKYLLPYWKGAIDGLRFLNIVHRSVNTPNRIGTNMNQNR